MSINKNTRTDLAPRLRSGSQYVLTRSKGLLLLLSLTLLLTPELMEAQCAICRAALESEADNSQAEGINNGIVYLMAVPYILVGGLFYLIYRKIRS